MSDPKVSIIVVNYNTKELTGKCIDSVLNSGTKVGYEIIVVDNGSVEKLKIKSEKLKIIENKENLGFSRANNQGIEKARGDYILLLNSDVKVTKGSVDALYSFAKSNPKIGAVVPRLLNPDESIQGSVFRLPTVVRAIKQYWLGEKNLLDKYAPKGELPITVEAAVMACFMITPQAIKKIGLLDERYFIYFEDLDYCRRVRRASLKVYYLPKVKVYHQHGASGGNIKELRKSSQIYHGFVKNQIYDFVLWSGQKWGRLWEK